MPEISNFNEAPRRFIFNDDDMHHFMVSPTKARLLQLTTAMGKACATPIVTPDFRTSYHYDPNNPLVGLSPAMAALHGSLQAMKEWLSDFPPLDRSLARFGNPAFRSWHARLMERSTSIISNIVTIYHRYHHHDDPHKSYDLAVLEDAARQGADAVNNVVLLESITNKQDHDVVQELIAYLEPAFGHPIRLDYGTGHECSFQVLLYAFCMLGYFGSTPSEPPTVPRLQAITISLWHAYLQLTRPLQQEYMLEPAGSHGVWGLDDYHCLPFYFGACQLHAASISQDANVDDDEIFWPKCIHNDSILKLLSDKYLYLGCIRFIKAIKRGVPFFESSPMLNDISQLPTWDRARAGLAKLFNGEVLAKRQVVQHFVFGSIFAADWIPSQVDIRQAPTETFRNMTRTPSTSLDDPVTTRAPWADQSSTLRSRPLPPPPPGDGFAPTRAPWAK